MTRKKVTTYLDEGLARAVRTAAAELELRDYEVHEQALRSYLGGDVDRRDPDVYLGSARRRRVTVELTDETAATLEDAARRRGDPVAALWAEALEEKAVAFRRANPPRLGTGAGGPGSRDAARDPSEPVADPPY